MKTSAEAVIIGGGCMGASTAYHLTRLGMKDIVLLERDSFLATGSTGRNAGGVRHQFACEANIRLSIESIRLFENFEEEIGYPIDFHQDGYLFLLSSEQSLSSFKSNAITQRRLGVDVAMLDPEEVLRLAPGINIEGIVGASFCDRDGIADPYGVTMGFAKAAESAGARIYRNTEVTDIKMVSGKVCAVETNKGPISTSVVVNAAGPYAQRIAAMAGVEIPVLPVRRHIFITEPVPVRNHIRVPMSRIMVIDFDSTFYFHREGAGILFGMADRDDEPGFDLTVKWEFLEVLTGVAAKRLPVLADLGIAHAWAGLYEMTPDAMPIIDKVAWVQGLYLINGFSGHGFQHCPAAGRILAELITIGSAQNCDLTAFSLARFSNGTRPGETAVV